MDLIVINLIYILLIVTIVISFHKTERHYMIVHKSINNGVKIDIRNTY